MAYLALYRKWRPRTFTEVVGQRHISIPLMRAIEGDRLAHAYLFSGPRGTGKTSMAKILAKAVNCLHPDGAIPCNECQNCKEINAGSSMDVYEIDAASNRGIEEIRALKESVRTLPSTCRKKVYIIDEVHMLTKEAFNALLKTLEEPPSHVLFILATTEPEKIPLTILSRCQRYEFHRISVEDIKQHLLHISKESGIDLTEDAADLIAVRADGGLRDALSLLDQCSAESGTLTAEVVYNLLGLTAKDRIIELSHHIFNGNSGEALTLFYQILQNGKEPAAILRDLLEHFRNLMMARVNPKAPELTAYGNKVTGLINDARQLSPAYLDGLFDYLHDALSETKRSSSPRMSAEMGLIRLCHIRGTKTVESLAERVSALEQEVEALRKGQPASPVRSQPAPMPSFPAPPAVPSPQPVREPISQPRPAPAPIPTFVTPAPPLPRESKPAAEKPVPHPPEPAPMKPQAATPPPVEASADAAELIDPSTYPAIWKKVLDYFMTIRRVDVYASMQKSMLIYATRQRAIVSAPQRFLVLAGNNPSYQKVMQEAFKSVTGFPMTSHTVLKGSPEEAEAFSLLKAGSTTPAPSPASPQENGFRQIRKDEIPAADRNDPSLKEALKILPDYDIYEEV